MRYLILIYGHEQGLASMTPEATDTMMQQYHGYSRALADAGVMRGGDELQPTFTATTLRMHEGTVRVTDGPFAETKEQLGGYYVIEAATLDEAMRWASQCPGIHSGSIELRPIVDHPQP